MEKKFLGRYGNTNGHWVGDGFPVRSLFSYATLGHQISPFLLFDYAGPYVFEPTESRRGVGQHPHRGFETVTIVYDGEVQHHDSAGNGGIIGPGDVQWMTAAGGLLHEEYHSPAFAKTGGPFRVVQLWVNLPAKDKMTPPAYQSITAKDIPNVDLPNGIGSARIIAGELHGAKGPARTFTPINVWDVRLKQGSDLTLDLPEGHNTIITVLDGHVTSSGNHEAGAAEVLLFSREGRQITLHTDGDTRLLVLTGEPIEEPIAGQGPFVMNTDAEIRQAFADYRQGSLAQPAA